MNVVEINLSNWGSTGQIMLGISGRLRELGHRVLICYPATLRNQRKVVTGSFAIGSRIGRNMGIILSKWFGCDDLLFRPATRSLIRQIERSDPDLVHLHNLHGWYINIPLLFEYLRKKEIPVVWTLHDCWPLTGHCTHFDRVGCGKWKTDCRDCPQHRDYPQSRVDNAARMLRVKRRSIAGLPGLTVVTPSEWLARLAKTSYLEENPIRVVNNGIDTTVFQPVASGFRSLYHLEGKIVLLGVAMGWDLRKGLDVFIRLAEDLDNRFGIVMVGTDEEVDKMLPNRIVSIHRTMNQQELAAIYTAADLFVNPTREDNYPTVNIEALACGTPVLTFNTGGSPEIPDPTCGSVVPKDDYDALKAGIFRVAAEHPYSPESCRTRALQLTCARMQDAYVHLFEELVGRSGA